MARNPPDIPLTSRHEYRTLILRILIGKLGKDLSCKPASDGKRRRALYDQFQQVRERAVESLSLPPRWNDVNEGDYRASVLALEKQSRIPGAAPLIHALVSGHREEIASHTLFPSTPPSIGVMLAAAVWRDDGSGAAPPFEKMGLEDLAYAPDAWPRLLNGLPISADRSTVKVLGISPTEPWMETQRNLRQWFDTALVPLVKSMLQREPLWQERGRVWKNFREEVTLYYDTRVIGDAQTRGIGLSDQERKTIQRVREILKGNPAPRKNPTIPDSPRT